MRRTAMTDLRTGGTMPREGKLQFLDWVAHMCDKLGLTDLHPGVFLG